MARLILVSCPALTEEYAAQLLPARLSHLSHAEAAEYEAGAAAWHTGDAAPLQRLVELAIQADSYALMRDQSFPPRFDAAIFRSVWRDAATLRQSGELLESIRQLACPVLAIHGDYDTSPAQGVSGPLGAALQGRDFRFLVLKKCGHTPWLEHFAKDAFYGILRQELASLP